MFGLAVHRPFDRCNCIILIAFENAWPSNALDGTDPRRKDMAKSVRMYSVISRLTANNPKNVEHTTKMHCGKTLKILHLSKILSTVFKCKWMAKIICGRVGEGACRSDTMKCTTSHKNDTNQRRLMNPYIRQTANLNGGRAVGPRKNRPQQLTSSARFY